MRTDLNEREERFLNERVCRARGMMKLYHYVSHSENHQNCRRINQSNSQGITFGVGVKNEMNQESKQSPLYFRSKCHFHFKQPFLQLWNGFLNSILNPTKFPMLTNLSEPRYIIVPPPIIYLSPTYLFVAIYLFITRNPRLLKKVHDPY